MQNNTPSPRITSKEAFAQIMAANGVYELAAERLHLTDSDGMPDVARLEAIVAADPQTLPMIQGQLKVFALLETFRTFKKLQSQVESSLVLLEADEAMSAFNKMLANLSLLTQEPQTNNTNINILEVAMRQFPPEVRDAIAFLSKKKPAANGNANGNAIGSADSPFIEGEIIPRDSNDEVTNFPGN